MGKQRYTMQEFASKHSLQVNKNCCYGTYEGYRVHVQYSVLGNPSCLITVVTDTGERKGELERFLEKHKRELKLNAYGVVGIGLMVNPQFYTDVYHQIETVLNKIVAYLKKNRYPDATVCPYCGQPLGEDGIEIYESGIPFAAHEACYERAYEQAKRKEAAAAASPKRKASGLLGAFCGILVGVVVFVMLFFLWKFAAFGAAVAVFLGGWLYGKFGGRNVPFKVVSVALCTLGAMLLTYFICLMVEAGGEGFAYIARNLEQSEEYRTEFFMNLLFIVVFDAIGTLYAVFSCLREGKKISANMRRAK